MNAYGTNILPATEEMGCELIAIALISRILKRLTFGSAPNLLNLFSGIATCLHLTSRFWFDKFDTIESEIKAESKNEYTNHFFVPPNKA
jgi:hypothetical protein